jgi:hypothetical protein
MTDHDPGVAGVGAVQCNPASVLRLKFFAEVV